MFKNVYYVYADDDDEQQIIDDVLLRSEQLVQRRRRRRRGRHDDGRARRRRRRRLKTSSSSNTTFSSDNNQLLSAAVRTAAVRTRRGGGRRTWQCGLEKYWRRTGGASDVFPAYVQTGRCSTPTCMMGLYECRERRYSVRVLRRRRGHCVPLPLTVGGATETTVEELWTVGHTSVVVACECSARRATGVFSRRPTTTSAVPP